MISILFLIIIISYYLTRFLINEKKIRKSFESKGIFYYGNGALRIFRNLAHSVSMIDDLLTQYAICKRASERFAGINDFGQVGLLIWDPELLKNILVKDFNHFTDRRHFQTTKRDFLMGKMLFFLHGESWKTLRSKLSPSFTSGQLKRIFKLFDDSGRKLVKYIDQQIEVQSNNGDIQLTKAYSKFTMDIISTVVCGIDSEAFNQEEPSIFELMGQKLQIQFGGLRMLKLHLILVAPRLADLFGLSMFPTDAQQFFSVVIKKRIQENLEKGEKVNDFIQLMLEARQQWENNQNEKNNDSTPVNNTFLDDDEIVANCLLFFLAGVDTTQTILLFSAYALAIHQEIQDKLREEIDSILIDNCGEFSYDSINSMTYLDMVVKETLRYYPAVFVTDRCCTIPYKIPGTDFVLNKGQAVNIPVFAMHHDPEYFPEPEIFDPERFSTGNKANINPYTYLAFGQGPRICIGKRFALTKVKVAIAHLVKNFKIEPCSKTPIPMRYQSANTLKPEGGMWLSFTNLSRTST